MRFSRVLAILVLLGTAIASFALAAAGCGGDNPVLDDMGSTDGPTMCTARGTLALDVECTNDCDCAEHDGVCTKAPYDRKVNPVCTIKCNPASPDPRCTMGCNMKGYC